jgi:hypothetical protein
MKKLLRRSLGRLHADEGSNLVEAALLLPLLLALTFAIVEFALVFYTYLALENGVSEATRYGITGASIASMSREDSIKSILHDATPTLTIPDAAITFSHLERGGSVWLAGVGGPGEIEKVQVDYTWDIITPLLRPLFTGGQVQLRVDSAMKNEERFD